MTNDKLLDELRKEIRELRREVREAGGIRFIPQPYPVYIPQYPQPYYQPFYAPFYTTTQPQWTVTTTAPPTIYGNSGATANYLSNGM